MEEQTALRLEPIKATLQSNEGRVQFRGRRHLAVLAVALTTFASAVAAGLTGQVRSDLALATAGVSMAVIGIQLRALALLEREMARFADEAVADIGKLMRRGRK